jgi:TPR repeat protein
LEIASERGNGSSNDRLYRYYSKGKHTLKDLDKAAYYLQKGCEQGYGDCLVAFFKKIVNDPDYESKISRYLDRLPHNGIVFLALADVYRVHGDEENYLKWLEKSAMNGYTGAMTRWLNYWINKEPLNLEKIELLNKRIINTQVDAAIVMADFYHERQDLCPGKFEWFIKELKKKDNVFVRRICEKYNLPLD